MPERSEAAAADPLGGRQPTKARDRGVQTRYHDDAGAPAWLATIKRI